MVSEVGDDHVAVIVTSFMKDNNVDTSLVTRRKGSRNHLSLAFLDGRNDAHYEFHKGHGHTVLDASSLEGITFGEDDIVLSVHALQ